MKLPLKHRPRAEEVLAGSWPEADLPDWPHFLLMGAFLAVGESEAGRPHC